MVSSRKRQEGCTAHIPEQVCAIPRVDAERQSGSQGDDLLSVQGAETRISTLY